MAQIPRFSYGLCEDVIMGDEDIRQRCNHYDVELIDPIDCIVTDVELRDPNGRIITDTDFSEYSEKQELYLVSGTKLSNLDVITFRSINSEKGEITLEIWIEGSLVHNIDGNRVRVSFDFYPKPLIKSV